MSDSDDVTRLPVRFKAPPDPDKTLLRPWEVGRQTCFHQQFIVDQELEQVECATCGERLNPMWVLSRLANNEYRWNETRKNYNAEMERLNKRKRTRCTHCGEMTRISGR